MDKRFKPLTPIEQLEERRVLFDDLAVDPTLPIPAVIRKIRKIRTTLRLTIAEYARLCGVSARTLQDIERGESSPTLATAEKLLKPVGMTVGAVSRKRR